MNRVTINTDQFGVPKGFAYVEFLEPEGVALAVAQNGLEFKGRPLKISKKRTNLPKHLLHDPMGGRGAWRGRAPYMGRGAARFGGV